MIAILNPRFSDGQDIIDAVNRTGLTGTNRDIELVCVIDEVLESLRDPDDGLLQDELREARRTIAALESKVFDLEYQNDNLKDELEERGVRSHE